MQVGHDIDVDASALLAEHLYTLDRSVVFRREMKQDEKEEEYKAKNPVITILLLEDHGLANLQGRPRLSPAEKQKALEWLRNLIAEQA
jgi:hypothetical protein